MPKHEKITVHHHGSEYDDKNTYRFQCCPECFSSNTETGYDGVNGVSYYHRTGYTYKKRIGIFDCTFVYVNHKCNDCGCIFSDEYEDKSKRRFMDVDKMVSSIIILVLLLILFVVSAVLSTSVEATGLFIGLWFFVSWIGVICFGLAFLICLISALV